MEEVASNSVEQVRVIPTASDVMMIGYGNCGLGVCCERMNQMDPEVYKQLFWTMIESNKRNMEQKCGKELPKDSNVRRWMDTGRVKLIQLGNGLGAGGNPIKGREMMVEKEKEVLAAIGNCETTFNIGGGGGGTGSGAMPYMADVLKKNGKHPFSILTIPGLGNQSENARIAATTKGELLEIGPLAAINNEYGPQNLTQKGSWAETNRGGVIPVLEIITYLTLHNGDVLASDREDWYAAMSKGNHVFTNLFDASKGLKDMEKTVLCNPYLDRRIVEQADSLIGWQRGPWEVMDAKKVKRHLFRVMRVAERHIHLWEKVGIEEDGVPETEKSLAFVLFAKNPPVRRRISSRQVSGADLPPAPPSPPLPPPAPDDDHSSNGVGQVSETPTEKPTEEVSTKEVAPAVDVPKVPIKGMVRTGEGDETFEEQRTLYVTQPLARDWSWLSMLEGMSLDQQRKARRILQEIAEQNNGTTFVCYRLPNEAFSLREEMSRAS